MADFYPLLSRAIAANPSATPEERAAIYDKARAALDRQLRGFDPPLADETIKTELEALEGVIRRIESEHLSQALVTEEAPAPLTAEAPLQPDGPQADASEPATDAAAPSSEDAAPAEEGAPAEEAAVEDNPSGEAQQDAPAADPPAPDPDHSAIEMPVIQPTLRPRIPDHAVTRGQMRNRALFAGVAIVAMLVLGLLALSRRETPRTIPNAETIAGTSEPQSSAPGEPARNDGSKSGDRLASVDQKDGEPAPQPQRPVPPASQPSSPTSAAPPADAQSTTSRAFMILESAGAAPNQFEGRTAWSFAPDPAARNQPTLRALVAFPEANLTIDIAMARNADAALNASHTIMVVFESGNTVQPVREMSAIEWRDNESQTGSMLSGIVVPVQDNVFMLGLDRAEASQTRNLDLLRTQKWLVFEIRLANGRRGAVLVEKGTVGEGAIASALAAWR